MLQLIKSTLKIRWKILCSTLYITVPVSVLVEIKLNDNIMMTLLVVEIFCLIHSLKVLLPFKINLTWFVVEVWIDIEKFSRIKLFQLKKFSCFCVTLLFFYTFLLRFFFNFVKAFEIINLVVVWKIESKKEKRIFISHTILLRIHVFPYHDVDIFCGIKFIHTWNDFSSGNLIFIFSSLLLHIKT